MIILAALDIRVSYVPVWKLNEILIGDAINVYISTSPILVPVSGFWFC